METDDGRYAAGIADPAHTRALKHGGAIPDRFGTATDERTGLLNSGFRSYPALRDRPAAIPQPGP